MGSWFISAEKRARLQALEERIGVESARAHAAMARVADLVAEFDEIEGWGEPGIRSLPHWLAINAGFNPHSGSELLRVGKALRVLPRIAQAFRAGRLSFDKTRQVTTVATPATEEMFLEIALGASGSQLERICRSMRRIAKLEASEHDQKQLAERGLWTNIDEDGMMRLVARLPSEEGAIVLAAIESVARSRPLPERSAEVSDPAEEPWAARRADALVSICELGGSPVARQVVVHLEVDGRAYIEGGAALSAEAARRIGCDAEVVAVTERDGLPIDVGRKQRMPTERLRRALEVRDRCCRFPGCGVPAHRSHAHHVEHWADGGATARDNLVLLCNFHHHRLHDGGYLIRKVAGGFSFETHDGQVIGSRLPHAVESQGFEFHPETARAEWGGAKMDFDHTIFVLANNSLLAEARAAPPS